MSFFSRNGTTCESILSGKSKLTKSTFTSCDYRKNDKCPPWELSANKITHNNLDKTVYYDDVVIRVYNIPIFYFPKLAHPDPSVKRRSGFLIPSYTQTKNLGMSLKFIPQFNQYKCKTNRFRNSAIPYFIDLLNCH